MDVIDTGTTTAAPAPSAQTQGLSGYYTLDAAGNVTWHSGAPPAGGGHWQTMYAGTDGTWSSTPDDKHSFATSWGVWVPDGRTAAAGGTGGGTGADDWITSMFPTMPEADRAVIRNIFAQETDSARAAQRAIAYIRSTTWWAQTYPGFNDGFSKGLYQDERGYRSLLNDYNQVYHQYLGRDITGAEMAQYLAQGTNPNTVGNIFQGAAIQKANAPDWEYTTGAFDPQGKLTAPEETAYGQELAGIDSPLGQAVMRRLQLAQKRLEAVFSGSAGSPNFGLGNTGLAASSLARGQTPDVSA